jgi:uncharacterized protein
MTIDAAKSMIKDAIDGVDSRYDSIDIQFMGGEPLMHFDLIRTVSEWLWTLDLKIPIESLSAPTNGTMLNDEMRSWFTANKHRFSLQLSFDGDRLMQNMNRSGSAKMIDLDFFARTFPDDGVKMTVSPQTIEQFYHGVRYLHEAGFKMVGANLAYGSNLGWNKSHLAVLSEELDKLVDYYSEHIELQPIGLLEIPVWNVLDKNAPDISCKCGRDVTCYDYDGEVYPCHIFSPITLPVKKARQSQKIDFEQVKNYNETACSTCLLNKMCIKCYGINYRDRDDCNSPSPFDCAQYKLFFYASCSLHYKRAVLKGDNEKIQIINKTIQLIKKSYE